MPGVVSGFSENISMVLCRGGSHIKEQDFLTGLDNWQTAKEKITELLEGEKVESGLLFYIDLDDFEEINETYGYPAGDETLRWISGQLQKAVCREGVAARIGGDEFLLFLGNIPGGKAAYSQAMQLYGACMGAGKRAEVTMSMGIACYPEDGTMYEELAARADEALYASKHSGKQCFLFYEDISKL